MINKLTQIIDKRPLFFRGSAILAILTLASYAFGLWRDRVFAGTFGASLELDAYNAGFILPTLILNIFVAGGLTAAFIPIFSQLRHVGSSKNISDFISSVLNSSLIVVLAACLLVLFFAGPLSHLVVPGFDDANRVLFTNLLRILIISPILFSISNLAGSILVAQQRMFWYGLSPVLYNLGIIGGTIFLSDRYGIYGVAYGVVIGSLLHLFPRVVATIRLLAGYRPKISFDHSFRKFISLMLPKMIGHPVEQFITLAFISIASTISTGSIALLTFAKNFHGMPINVIGITIATTAFASLSGSAASGDHAQYKTELAYYSRMILLFSLLAAVLIFILKTFLVDLLIGTGKFSMVDVSQTATLLGFFAFAIPSESLNHLQARAFYSLKDSKTPVLLSLLGLALAVIGALLFRNSLGLIALPLFYSISSTIKVTFQYILLRRKIANLKNINP